MKTPQILGAASLYLIPLAGLIALFLLAACNPPAANLNGPPRPPTEVPAPEVPDAEPTPRPTPDLKAAVAEQVRKELDAMDLPATISAQVRRELEQREDDRTPTPTPTRTPTPAETPAQNPTATPSWESTGHWHRDHDAEAQLATLLNPQDNAPWLERSNIRIAVLDAQPAPNRTSHRDLSFSLGCIGPIQFAYIEPYTREIPDRIDAHWYGLWDEAQNRMIERIVFTNPRITDAGNAVYLQDPTRLRRVLELLRQADQDIAAGNKFYAGILTPGNSGATPLLSEFDPTGSAAAVEYLTCFQPQGRPGSSKDPA